jgi:hypothetical protein
VTSARAAILIVIAGLLLAGCATAVGPDTAYESGDELAAALEKAGFEGCENFVSGPLHDTGFCEGGDHRFQFVVLSDEEALEERLIETNLNSPEFNRVQATGANWLVICGSTIAKAGAPLQFEGLELCEQVTASIGGVVRKDAARLTSFCDAESSRWPFTTTLLVYLDRENADLPLSEYYLRGLNDMGADVIQHCPPEYSRYLEAVNAEYPWALTASPITVPSRACLWTLASPARKGPKILQNEGSTGLGKRFAARPTRVSAKSSRCAASSIKVGRSSHSVSSEA